MKLFYYGAYGARQEHHEALLPMMRNKNKRGGARRSCKRGAIAEVKME
jgi:hypothetical protein